MEIRGITATLYSKSQYYSLKGKKPPKEKENSIEHILSLTNLNYVQNENVYVYQRMANIELSITPENKTNCLILKADSSFNYVVVALNSSHKYYCQLIFFSPSSGIGIISICSNLIGLHNRLINFISSEDVLPTDKYGRSSMLISDIAWTPNDLYVVVSFCENYFCVVSRLGTIINLLCLENANQTIKHFYPFPLSFANCSFVKANKVYIYLRVYDLETNLHF